MHERSREVNDEISAISLLATEEGELDAVLERACRALAEAIPADMVAILDRVVEAGREELRVRPLEVQGAAAGGEAGDIDLVPAGVLEELVESLQARVLSDPATVGRELGPLVENFENSRVRSCLLIPLAWGERFRGFVVALASEPDAFDEDQVPLARVFTRIVSLALECAEQYRVLREVNRRLAVRSRLLSTPRSHLPRRRRVVRPPWLSEAMVRVEERVRELAAGEAPVLLAGEPGAGKGEVADELQRRSPRRDGPYLAVSLARLSPDQAEDELLGSAGATVEEEGFLGCFEVADGGTLLLEEVEELPARLQRALREVLAEGRIRRVGEDRAREVDVWVLATTREDLDRAAAEGRFLPELRDLLGVERIDVPPLRERPEDLPALFEEVVGDHHRRHGGGPWRLTSENLEVLRAQPWPGNLREFENVVEHACMRSSTPELEFDPAALRPAPNGASWPADGDETAPCREDWPSLEEYTRRYLRKALLRSGGQVEGEGGAARLLGLAPAELREQLDELGIDAPVDDT